ncbi:MAG: VWA domain-containing protein [Spirochaetales bacterium]|nr:VWA domain-containing protein [Spirochaetales bacterium]
MRMTIKSILNELYEIDPSFKDREKEIEKTVKKLMESKIDAPIDNNFKQSLKKRLLSEMGKTRPSLFKRLLKPRLILSFGGAFAVLAVLLVFILMQTGPQDTRTKSDLISETSTNGRMEKMENKEMQSLEKVIITETEEKTVISRLDSSTISDTKSKPKLSGETDGKGGYKDEPGKPDVLQGGDLEELTLNYQTEAFEGSGYNPDGSLGSEGQTPPQYKDLSNLVDKYNAKKDAEKFNTEEYTKYRENGFLKAIDNPLSTFSIDVDTASYANVRRFLSYGELPPPDAVRIEELVNYFTYDYPEPTGEHPFAFATEISACPWEESHKLLLIGLQGRKMELASLPPSNLVFLIDVSGSMDEPEKLGLLKKAFGLLTEQMRPNDRVAIVVYAGAAGLVLPSTSGEKKRDILASLDKLEAGGSTAGSEGIQLAYETAANNFLQGGNNRVILATDGDFNVGPSSEGELVRLIEEKRKQGIYLTILGFGMGNYKDSKMEQLADKGNGNYAYIDNLKEAAKVLVKEMAGTLFTIAKDVKLQLEFNPARVDSYRLIGYSNRMLAREDFEDDTKDAGELGAGHTVTALYEIVPAKGYNQPTELKYQTTKVNEQAYATDDIVTLKFRYKKPDSDTSIPIEVAVRDEDTSLHSASVNFRFASAVAEWGLILSQSEYKENASYRQVLELARSSLGYDEEGYRNEFVSLVEESSRLGE